MVVVVGIGTGIRMGIATGIVIVIVELDAPEAKLET